MPRITKPLSDTEIKKSKKRDKTYKLSDGQGLYLVVKNNGTKFFRFDYTFKAKRKSMSFGVYPELSLKSAREKREEAKKLISNNLNPIDNKNYNSTKLSSNFESVADKWLGIMKSEWKAITYTKTKSRLEQHVYPFIGNQHIKDITRLDILNIIDNMQSQDIFDLTTRVLNNIERIFKYAVTYVIVEHNIVADIDKRNILKRKDVKHISAITDEKKIKELMHDINNYEHSYRADISTIYALKLAPYVFLRPFNLRHLEWKEIDFTKKIIEISKEKMKSGKIFILPLSEQSLEILEAIKPYSFQKSDFVFPSPISNIKPMSENTLNHALMRMGYKNIMTAHGFRSMFSTIAHEKVTEHGFSSDIIESCLAHIEPNKVKSAYNRDSKMKYFEEKQKLLEWWANWVN